MRLEHGTLPIIVLVMLTACSERQPLDEGLSTSNVRPTASFSVACIELECVFTDASADVDGRVTAHAWQFGDGGTSTAQHPTHSYSAPGGQYTVTLIVTDDRGDTGVASQHVDARNDVTSTVYERYTPHGVPGRHSRYVIHDDGRFEIHDVTGTDTTVHAGRWVHYTTSYGVPLPEGMAIALDFDDFQGFESRPLSCGEGHAAFPMEGYMAISYCHPLHLAGLEEGFYATVIDAIDPVPPPAGQIAFVRDGLIHRVNTDGTGLVQLTTGPGDSRPAWSRDGSRIAFDRYGGDAAGIYVADADGSNATRLIEADAYGSGAPAWSPDGAWIVFSCKLPDPLTTVLCKASTATAPATPIHITMVPGWASQPSWSPDGSRIAFTADWNMYDIIYDVWIMASDGSQPSPLTGPPYYEFGNYDPDWSPDGRRIAFSSCLSSFVTCSSSIVSVMEADGSGVTRLAPASGFARPTWSPDGQSIAFGSSGVIEWISADGTRRGRIIDNGYSPAWRP